jgi:hypothetical protein
MSISRAKLKRVVLEGRRPQLNGWFSYFWISVFVILVDVVAVSFLFAM